MNGLFFNVGASFNHFFYLRLKKYIFRNILMYFKQSSISRTYFLGTTKLALVFATQHFFENSNIKYFVLNFLRQ